MNTRSTKSMTRSRNKKTLIINAYTGFAKEWLPRSFAPMRRFYMRGLEKVEVILSLHLGKRNMNLK